jgi:hypothetical protein
MWFSFGTFLAAHQNGEAAQQYRSKKNYDVRRLIRYHPSPEL